MPSGNFLDVREKNEKFAVTFGTFEYAHVLDDFETETEALELIEEIITFSGGGPTIYIFDPALSEIK